MAQLIQSGKANKRSPGKLVISFDQPYPTPPTVVISPYLREQGVAVGHIETIDEITVGDFTVVSNNNAGNYFITWIAIGDAQ